ncbi:hypothetical protein Prudu_016431 [Prunus dulcis]|uniref:Ankyrin repeat family protein n=1 Tax=Prunus dulcis TaxID=3755 RepID=A0A4Y1RMJ6_PRUDU|nr:hypothetical protein Prudu_016431 [Prunus dulcis]
MSRRWIHNPSRCADEYLDGIEDFIEFARRHNPGATRIRCPCRRCNNTLWETIENVGFHLVRNGMIETYSIWNLYREQLDHASSSNATRMDSVEPIVDPNDQVLDIIQDAFPFASTNINHEREDDVPTPIDNTEFEQYEKLLKNANQELYPGCESFSVLTAIVELMHEKIKYRMSNLCFDYFLGVFKRMLPTDNCLPKDHKHAQKVLNGLGLGYEKIHACKNNCMLFYKEHETLDTCPICNESRFKMTSQNRTTKIPKKSCRLYMSTHTAIDMRWHKEKRVDDDVMRHPADGEAWKEFDRTFLKFAVDPRNVDWDLPLTDSIRMGICNGFWMEHKGLYDMSCMQGRCNFWLTCGKSLLPWSSEMVAMGHKWREKDKEFAGTQSVASDLENGPLVGPDLYTYELDSQAYVFELPYWSKLKLRHKLDVMHVEKNVFDTLVGTILDIEGKTKDTIKARLDLERMGIRRGLWMNRDSDKARRDLAFFSMKPNDKKEFLKFVSSIKFPDGYASNIARCVNVDGGKFTGLKSYDCHEDVVKPIMLSSRFFSQLTAKTLRKTDIFQLCHDIVQVLCKFEMIFPPAFFTSMMHVMVHLPEEALLAGPVNYRWMYPIERLLGELKKSVRNGAKPEGSIIEAWVQYESLTFCGMYLKDVETAFNRPQRNNDGGMRKENFLFLPKAHDPLEILDEESRFLEMTWR